MAFQHCITPKPNNAKPLNLNEPTMIQIRKFYDTELMASGSHLPTSQTNKAMSAEEFLINQGYTKIVTYPNKEVVEITFRWETVIRLLNEYTSQFQPLPVGGKSVDNCFDEIGNKINTLQDVNLKNRLHAAKDLLKLHLQSSLPVQQPVSDGVEFAERDKRYKKEDVSVNVMVMFENGNIEKGYYNFQTENWIYQACGSYPTHWLKKATTPIVEGYSAKNVFDACRKMADYFIDKYNVPNSNIEIGRYITGTILSSLPQSTSITK